MWNGRITRRDDALRLLLIIDYVFDWARDLYRPNIFHDLKTLVARDTASLAEDSDIFSSMDAAQQIDVWLSKSQPDDDPLLQVRNEQDSGIPQSFLALDSEYGVIRHASFIQNLLVGLYITSDDLESLLLSFPTAGKAQNFAREVVKAMKECWRAKADTLDALEVKWTGKRRHCEEFSESETTFYLAVELTAYMSPLWDQVREFAYVAVAEDAVDLLSTQAGLSEPVNIRPEDHPIIGEQALESYCDRVQNVSIMDNLLAAMSSASLNGKASHEDYPPVSTLEKTSRLTLGFKPDVTGHIRRMVSTIYSSHKIGRREPSEPFLRVSKRHDQQSREANVPTVWPQSGRTPPEGGDGVLLLHSSADDLKAKVPKWCYYIVNGPVEISDGWRVLQTVDETFRNRPKYYVRCRDVTVESVRTHNDYTRAAVNLGDVGWYHQEDFLKWLNYLVEIARKTTSPRISSPVQVPQAYPGDLDPSRSLTPMDANPKDVARPAPASPVRPGPSQASGSGKRQSDVIIIDDDDDAQPGPSKRQKRTFQSDCITDAEYQQLLEDNYFGEASRSNEPESGE